MHRRATAYWRRRLMLCRWSLEAFSRRSLTPNRPWARSWRFIHLFIYSFIHWFIHPFILSSFLSLIHWFIDSSFHSLSHWVVIGTYQPTYIGSFLLSCWSKVCIWRFQPCCTAECKQSTDKDQNKECIIIKLNRKCL